jgi:hypothetical protein
MTLCSACGGPNLDTISSDLTFNTPLSWYFAANEFLSSDATIPQLGLSAHQVASRLCTDHSDDAIKR